MSRSGCGFHCVREPNCHQLKSGEQLLVAAGAATLALAIGLVVAYLDLRTTIRFRRLLDALAALPLGLPGTVLAVALILAFLRPPLHLYGTIWILLVAYVGRAVPLATRGANGALRQIDVAPEVARIGRASPSDHAPQPRKQRLQ